MTDIAEIEYVAGQNLRASHEIVSLLEMAKRNSDSLIARLPDLYLIIDSNAVIWKGNERAAQLLQVGSEELVKIPFARLFKPETWKIMRAKIQSLVDGGQQKDMEFELPLDASEQGSREYFWNMRFYNVNLPDDRKLICILGRDISQIRQYQRQMTQIFLSIPLGIVTMDKEGMIAGPCSAFTEHLLGKTQLSGQSLKKLLFEPALEKDKMDTIFAAYGCEDFFFESMKPHFPKEIPYDFVCNGETERRWLGLSYHPIYHGEAVEKLLVIMEDRTEVVNARNRSEQQKNQEESLVNRILEVSRCEEELLETSFSEYSALFARLIEEFEAGKIRNVCSTLHTIKGISRTCNFSRLKTLVHEFEDILLKSDQSAQVATENGNKNRLLEIRIEYRELCTVHNAFSKRVNPNENSAPQSEALADELRRKVLGPLRSGEMVNYPQALQKLADDLESIIGTVGKKPLKSLEKTLRSRALKTMERLGKTVDIVFSMDDVMVSEKSFQGASEACLHLLNNALDHGIEPVEEREVLGKNLQGRIEVSMSVSGQEATCRIADDGKGLSPEGLRRAAVRKGMISEEEATQLSDSEALYLIVRPGFSTASVVSDVSGRGIGLDAVVETVNTLGGDGINISSRLGMGTTFSFSFKI